MKQKRIILLHGWGASTEKLQPLKVQLEKLGWEVMLPELPGFDAPEPESPWSLQDYSEYVQKSANEKWKDGKYCLFGHSFGGRITIKTALNENNRITGIVLCATGGISRGNSLKRFIFYLISKTGKLLLFYKPLAQQFRKILYKLAREHDYEKSSDLMKQIMQNVINEDLKPELKKIKLNTLILWGKLDRVTPYEDALLLKNSLKKAKLVTFEDQKHTLPYKKANQIAKEINTWNS